MMSMSLPGEPAYYLALAIAILLVGIAIGRLLRRASREHQAEQHRQVFRGQPGAPFDAEAGNFGRLEALLHQRTVRNDVEAPALELGHLALGLADDQPDDGLVQPLRLGQQSVPLGVQLLAFIGVIRGSDSGLPVVGRLSHLGSLRQPQRFDHRQHARAGHLVDAHQHGLARLPAGAAMLHKVRSYSFQPFIGGDDFVVLAQQLFQ